VDEVARSFMVSEQAMAMRLVRAKYNIKAAKIPYRVLTRPTCLLG
jgi:RNA polymerase sigma-70 factor, ECF subfamily